ncbi:MAG: hypothetical protein R3C49_00035 [Planctomycetaceae bacterium]
MYSATTMANSAAVPRDASLIEKYHEYGPSASGGFRYRAEEADEKIYHHEQLISEKGEVLFDHSEEIAWEIGSGKRGRSYLVQHDDQLFMSPITWYSTTMSWDLSPDSSSTTITSNGPLLRAASIAMWVDYHSRKRTGRIDLAVPPSSNRASAVNVAMALHRDMFSTIERLLCPGRAMIPLLIQANCSRHFGKVCAISATCWEWNAF